MVLAAGLGTRMRPLTDRVPKPLVMLDGRPLLGHVLDRLADAGVKRAVVNVHHLADQIEAYLAARSAPEIIVSDEREAVLETGGGVKKALPYFGGRPFLVHNSNSVWSEGAGSNLRLLMDAWKPVQMDALLLLARRKLKHRLRWPGRFSPRRVRPVDEKRPRRGNALRVCRCVGLEAAALRWLVQTGLFVERDFRQGDCNRQASRHRARWNLDARWHAGSVDRGGEPFE